MNKLSSKRNLIFLVCLIGVTGCSSVDRMGSKLDMAADHELDNQRPQYEGKLDAPPQRIGSMTALQFADGQFYNVEIASLSLQAGDTVRIYKTDKGLEAHLWKAAENPEVSNSTVTASPHHGS